MSMKIFSSIILVWMISGFSAFSKENNHETSPNAGSTPTCYEVCGFNGHSLVVGAATACYLLSSSYDSNQSYPEAGMNGVKATSLGILTSYLLNFSAPIIKSTFDYALESVGQKIFCPINTMLEDRIEQLNNVLSDNIKQANETSFGGFFNAIVNGNSQGNQE